LEDPGQLVRERHVAGEDHPNARPASHLDHPHDPGDERLRVRQMPHDPDLHVVHEQRHPLRPADLLQRLRDLQPVGVLHPSPTSSVVPPATPALAV
jgi:hypothetical protein